MSEHPTRDVDDVRSGAAVVPAIACWLLAMGTFFGALVVAGPTPTPEGTTFLWIATAVAGVLLLAGVVIAVRWVLDLWEAGES